MKNRFFIHKVPAVFILVLGILGLLVSLFFFIYYFVKGDVFEPIFFMLIFSVGVNLLNGMSKKGTLDTIKISEEGIIVNRIINKQVASSSWDNIVSITEVNDGYGGSIKIACNKKTYKKSHIIYMDYNAAACQLLYKYFDETESKKQT